MENRPWQRHYDYNVPTTIRYPRIPAHELINLPAGSFPNKPATNFFGTEITFYDIISKEVLQIKTPGHVIDVSELKTGMYFIEFVTGDWNIRKKLIIR